MKELVWMVESAQKLRAIKVKQYKHKNIRSYKHHPSNIPTIVCNFTF